MAIEKKSVTYSEDGLSTEPDGLSDKTNETRRTIIIVVIVIIGLIVLCCIGSLSLGIIGVSTAQQKSEEIREDGFKSCIEFCELSEEIKRGPEINKAVTELDLDTTIDSDLLEYSDEMDWDECVATCEGTWH